MHTSKLFLYKIHACVLLVLLMLPASLVVPLRAAGPIFVVPGGAGARTGSNWANALDLQAALALATSGDQLWVEQGSYKPTLGSDRTISFKLKSGIALYGGFAGTEQALEQRNFTGHPTILSGDIGTPGFIDDNSYHVVDASSTTSDTIIDGVTITGGNSNLSPTFYAGGGMIAIDSDIVIKNVVFSNNIAHTGGGLVTSGGNPLLAHVTFFQNIAINTNGGGMSTSLGHPIISHARFVGNKAGIGGGLFAYAPRSTENNVTIIQSVFSGNTAESGGAIFNSVGSITLAQVSFGANSAKANQAGAIYSNGGQQVIRNSIFWNNGANPIIDWVGATSDIRNSLVQGGYITGTNILDTDPRFVNVYGADNNAGTLDDDLRLQSPSPAIDAGDDAFLPADVIDDNNNGNTNEPAPFDLSGLPRLVGVHVDLGAYEWQPPRHVIFYVPMAMR